MEIRNHILKRNVEEGIMGIQSRSLPDHNVIVLTHIGRIPDDEVLDFYETFFSCSAAEQSTNLLVDLRETDSTLRSADVLRRFADSIRHLPVEIAPGTRVAVVAPEDLAFGLARMYGSLADAFPWVFSVFRSMEEARLWLGLP